MFKNFKRGKKNKNKNKNTSCYKSQHNGNVEEAYWLP